MRDHESTQETFLPLGDWQIVHVPTGNIVVAYDTKQEADDAVAWLAKWQPKEAERVEVRHA